jgi:hypothetical protein
MVTARVNYAPPTRATLFAGGACILSTSAGATAEARALHGFQAGTGRVILAGHLDKVSTRADRGAIAVSLRQHPLWWADASAAHPVHALLPLLTAVEALATVILVSIKVYAPVVATGLAFRAATNLVVSTPYAVPRAALGVPPTFPSQTPAIVGPGHPWEGGQRSS